MVSKMGEQLKAACNPEEKHPRVKSDIFLEKCVGQSHSAGSKDLC